MATLAIYNSKREKIGDMEVDDSVFGVSPKEGILHEVVKWQMARRRAGTASTKTRSEVRGGGRKPWRQKGTGRARVGSIRSPLWRHGGTTFGPRPRDYSYSLPKKVRKLALKMAVSDKVASNRVYVLKEFGLEEIKTRKMASLLGLFEIDKALIVTADRDRTIELSARNIPGIKVLTYGGLNVYDLLKHEYLIMQESAVKAVEERLKS